MGDEPLPRQLGLRRIARSSRPSRENGINDVLKGPVSNPWMMVLADEVEGAPLERGPQLGPLQHSEKVAQESPPALQSPEPPLPHPF